MHMKEFTVPAAYAGKPECLARLWVEKLDALLDMDLPFKKIGIAHLVCYLIGGGDDVLYQNTLAALEDKELRRIFGRICAAGAGVEINKGDFSFDHGAESDILRIFRIAKEEGCKFYLGSDSHHPKGFEKSKDIFERAIKLLELHESDKFII